MNKINDVKNRVYKANKSIVDMGLVIQSFGNASSRFNKQCLIKPSGIKMNQINSLDIVSVEIETGNYTTKYKPSSDTPTHIELYKTFDNIGGVVHTHSLYATSWAQANMPIPCLGTTHADYWIDAVPITDILTDDEINSNYEKNTGIAIIKKIKQLGFDPLDCPGILVVNHGVFTWGETVEDAANNAELIEYIALLAFNAININDGLKKISRTLHSKHFKRKHGPDSYYGQQ